MTRAPRRGRALAAGLVAGLLALTACTGSDPSPAPSSQSPVPPPAPSSAAGVTASPLGLEWDWPRADRYAGLLTDLRGGSRWYEMEWCLVEPQQGQRDWTAVDRNIARVRERGLEVFLKIRTGSCWATRPLPGGRARGPFSPSGAPVDEAVYTEFVRAVAQRYAPQGVRTYAIENEVNAEDFWAGTPEEYARIAEVGTAAVHSVDAGLRVADNGLSSTAYGVALAQQLLDQGRDEDAVRAYDQYYERRFARREEDFPRADNAEDLRRALATPQSQRNLRYVEVSVDLARRKVVDLYQLHLYERWTNAAPVVAYLRAAMADAVPIEAWEVGIFWPQQDPDFQVLADETAKMLASLFASGVQKALWLPAAFNPEGRGEEEVRWGLFEPDGAERPAANVLRVLAQATGGGVSSWAPVDRPGLTGAVLTGPAGALAILWSSAGDVPLELAPGTTVEKAGGGPAAAQVRAAQSTVGEAPLLLRNPAARGVDGLLAR